jgi:pimeloyl-ACP methyl ester carboxylesterase
MSSARVARLRSMTTFVLLPGAGSDSWFYSRVEPLLRERGHEAIAVDLPLDDTSAGWAEYADVAADAVRGRAGDGAVVVVGQSMGAFTAPLVAERVAVDELVLLCPMIPAPREPAGSWWEGARQDEAAREQALAEGRDPDAPFDLETTFLHDVPADVTVALMARGEPPQPDKPFEDPWPRDAWPDVPTRVIAGARDRLFPLPLVQRLARERLGVDHVDVVDAGHMAALVVPDRIAALLTRS